MVQKYASRKMLEASLLVVSNELTPIKARREGFAAIISELSDSWIEQKPLFEVAFRLVALHRIDPLTLTGDRLAVLIKRLTQSELKPGGPYCSTAYDAHLTNLAVQKLLIALGVNLGALDAYLMSTSPSNLSPFEKKAHNALKHTLAEPKELLSQKSEDFTNDVVEQTKSYLLGIDPALYAPMNRMIEKVSEVDVGGEVSRLAFDFYCSLVIKPPSLNRQVLIDIGVANYCAWVAYAIYDDFIDNEGKPMLLPIANIAHRYSITKYQQVAESLGINSKCVINALDSVDIGSSIELRKFKAEVHNQETININSLPEYVDYAVLSERALGFLAGPILILETLRETTAAQKDLMLKGLSLFLQARQISDDLMDWRSDLHTGKLTSVVTRCLVDANIAPSSYNIGELAQKLSSQLWKSTLVDITNIIESKVDEAEIQIEKSGIFASRTAFCNQYLKPLTRTSVSLKSDHELKRQFLRAYGN